MEANGLSLDMRWRDVISLLSAVISIWPHTTFAQIANPADPNMTLVRKTFTLGGTSFVIFLPENAVVDETAVPEKVYIDFRKNTRDQRMIIFTSTPPSSNARYDQEIRLVNGGQLNYRTDENIGGGSSGAIAQLTGRMEIATQIISVECTDQDKFYPKTEWCLPYVRRLEPVKQGQ